MECIQVILHSPQFPPQEVCMPFFESLIILLIINVTIHISVNIIETVNL